MALKAERRRGPRTRGPIRARFGSGGPPGYLRPERVQLAAAALRATSYAELIGGVDPAELSGAEVYPLGWSEPDALEWGRPWHDGLTQFFEAAARAEDAMLVWLD
jgi:hypothetical protein